MPDRAAREPTPIDERRLERVEDDTDEHGLEIRDLDKGLTVLAGKVELLTQGIASHERLDGERDTATKEALRRIEEAIKSNATAKAAATGELAETSREKIKATAQVVVATLSTVGLIAGLIYGAGQMAPAPVAPGTAHQQAAEGAWRDGRAEEKREDAVDAKEP